MTTYADRCLALLRSGRPVVVFDLETTGLLPERRFPDRPIPHAWEFGVIRRIRRGPQVVRREGRLVINVGLLPDEIVEKFHLPADIAVREGLPPQEQLAKAALVLNEPLVLVGHNVTAFDAVVLAGDFRLAGLPVPACLLDEACHVDTLLLARELLPRGAPGSPSAYNLETMAAYVGYDTTTTTFHRALDDTRATEAILLFLARKAIEAEAKRA
jgi:DNA polymerase III epsilon subunit-like protein